MRSVKSTSTTTPPAWPSVLRAHVDKETGRPSRCDISMTRSATMKASARSTADEATSTSAEGTQPAGAVVAGSARNPPPIAVPATSAMAATSSSS
eukprot:scaffold306352_cov27-Tisochrysis_lutea.AAC.2